MRGKGRSGAGIDRRTFAGVDTDERATDRILRSAFWTAASTQSPAKVISLAAARAARAAAPR